MWRPIRVVWSHFHDLIGDQAMRFFVHGLGRIGGGCLSKAVDFALILVNPIRLVVDAVLPLGGDVFLVGVGNGLGSDLPLAEFVNIEKELPFRRNRGGRGRGWPAAAVTANVAALGASFFASEGILDELGSPLALVHPAAMKIRAPMMVVAFCM